VDYHTNFNKRVRVPRGLLVSQLLQFVTALIGAGTDSESAESDGDFHGGSSTSAAFAQAAAVHASALNSRPQALYSDNATMSCRAANGSFQLVQLPPTDSLAACGVASGDTLCLRARLQTSHNWRSASSPAPASVMSPVAALAASAGLGLGLGASLSGASDEEQQWIDQIALMREDATAAYKELKSHMLELREDLPVTVHLWPALPLHLLLLCVEYAACARSYLLWLVRDDHSHIDRLALVHPEHSLGQFKRNVPCVRASPYTRPSENDRNTLAQLNRKAGDRMWY
jgi:hypothetical protein